MKKNNTPVAHIPEVIEYLNAQDSVEEFETAHKKTFEKYRELVETRNTLLEAADKRVRQLETSCGPFDMYQIKTLYDAQELYQSVGRDLFLAAGGHVDTVTSYSVDGKKLEAAVAAKKIPNDVLEHVRKFQPAYHAPKKALLP